MFKKKALLVGEGSNSVKIERIDGDLAGDDQHFASKRAAYGCIMTVGTENLWEHEDKNEFVYTACGHSVAIFQVRAHPVLHVGICEFCYAFHFSSPFTKDNPEDPFEHENECRWCGDGGEVILCDSCPKVFCKPCIKRNFGEDMVDAIVTPLRQWNCFVCDDVPLKILKVGYKNAMNHLKYVKADEQNNQDDQVTNKTQEINKTNHN